MPEDTDDVLLDKWAARGGEAYTGRDYRSGHTEILTKGIQRLALDSAKFYVLDPEYFEFIVTIFRGWQSDLTMETKTIVRIGDHLDECPPSGMESKNYQISLRLTAADPSRGSAALPSPISANRRRHARSER